MSWKETNPLDIWKTSTIIPIGPDEAKQFEHTSPQIPIASERPKLWQSISELRGKDQTNYMNLLISNWPYKFEKRAFEFPVYVASFTNSLVSLYIANKLVSKAFFDHINAGFFETIRRSSKAPFVLAFYTGSLTTFGLWHLFVKSKLVDEETPCGSCVLAGSYLTMALSGIGMPLMTTPWIVHFMAANEGIGRIYPKNILEAFVINYKFSKPLFKTLPKLFAIQLVVASACVYSALWARERIFDTFDVDPEIIREAITLRPKDTWNTWANNKFQDLMAAGSTKDIQILENSEKNKQSPLSRFRTMFDSSEESKTSD